MGLYLYKYISSEFLSNDDVFLDLPDIKDPNKPDIEIFLALSQLVTLHEDLSKESAQKLFDVFVKEPGGWDNTVKTFETIRGKLRKGAESTQIFDDLKTGDLGQPETWFIQHLLTTWYTGVYYSEGKEPLRLLCEDALLWKPLKGIFPIPFVESMNYGDWSKHPNEIAQKNERD